MDFNAEKLFLTVCINLSNKIELLLNNDYKIKFIFI
jgi:hypothetical protein